MARLFDSTVENKKAESSRRSRDESRQRAEEVDRILKEEGLLNDSESKLGNILGAGAASAAAGGQTVEAIRYEHYRKPGSRWAIEHAKVGSDYVFQLFPLKPPAVPWQDVMLVLIAIMDVIYPRSVKLDYIPPNDTYQVKFYTIKVNNVVGLPGWEVACKERALHGLSAADVWSRSSE